MLIDALTFTLRKSGALDPVWDALDEGRDATLGVAASARPFLVAARFAARPQPTLVLVAGEEAAATFARNVASYVGDERVLHFPARSDHPFDAKAANPRQAARRMEAAWALQTARPVIVVASATSLLRTLPPAKAQAARPLSFAQGNALDAGDVAGLSSFDDVARALEERGYQNTGELDGHGTFCVRGGTIDVYPGNLVYPVRLDFFGDELDEIRRIVPSTGQTIATLDSVEIYPVQEFQLSAKGIARVRKKLARPAESNPALREVLEKLEGGARFEGADVLLPYLYDDVETLSAYTDPAVRMKEDAGDKRTAAMVQAASSTSGAASEESSAPVRDVLTVLVEPRSLFDDAVRAYDDIAGRAKGTNIALEGLYTPAAQLDFGTGQRMTYVSIMRLGGSVDAELPVKRADVAGSAEKLFGKLRGLIDQNYTVVFSAPNFRARQDIKLAFVDHELPIVEVLDVNDSVPARLRRSVVNVVDVEVPLGMVIPKAKLAILSLADTQGATSAARASRRVDITEVTFPFKPGDYVVHAAHGVAFFRDLVQRDVGGVVRDYLQLEYAEGDKLFVPVEQLDRVTRYVGPEGSSPRLTRLNTSDWSRALTKARKATKKLAFDLVDVYTRRAASQGFRYSPDTPWQREMEESFPYQETADQLAAIADVKADMQSSRPMDRLVCGDVGFGKTEVALRAAFKATQDKKQVMVLCPTTVLAQQHYANFKDRFEPFGVQVEVLSRFRTPEQQKKALEGFADGSIPVLVGTHRLLSRDVNPHDLGLVIIDEEQRFGVGHKEQLKNLRESIDVLTLSATPIPRTMQMSLSGVRDMSLILTPPEGRRPVEVHVGEWDPDIVSGAIRRELARGGQVYYVSNRVRSIEDAVARVQAAAGEARVGVAHGQMTKEELERAMEEFSAGETDVLVATTIIESGLDNPHTNTLIIEDAQRLGLAQMYQLKGRVGRSTTQAYAYFMFPEHVSLTEEATARLEAINEHRDLGSGMRIAMRDLEIRGAGSLLGAEQSGNMSSVGFDLFAQMLAQAVADAREGKAGGDGLPPALSDITVNLPEHAYIPEEYVPDADERVLVYRKVASADTLEAVEEIYADLKGRRPEMPQATENYFAKARIKAYANEHGIQTVTVAAGKVNVEPVAQPPADFMKTARRMGGRYVAASKKLQLPMKYFKLGPDGSLLDAVWKLVQEIA